jgi:DNA polymerase elongation subunit (family B)
VRLRSVGQGRILDFDIETVAAGFADPEWVPQKITCVAWSWVDSDEVESAVCGPAGIFGRPSRRAKMLKPLLAALDEAAMVTGHNILRFDLPVIQAEVMRLGLPNLPRLRVQDTIRLPRSKGFKKGQDNLETLFETQQKKLALNWQEWQDAYDEDGWQTIRDRAETDVAGHKQIRLELLERGYLKEPMTWNP